MKKSPAQAKNLGTPFFCAAEAHQKFSEDFFIFVQGPPKKKLAITYGSACLVLDVVELLRICLGEYGLACLLVGLFSSKKTCTMARKQDVNVNGKKEK